MTQELPKSVELYFSGKNERDFARAVSGFSHTAVARDEAQDYRGPAAIRAWMEETFARYADIAEVESFSSADDRVDVVAAVSGTFPGSPIRLRFSFTLADDLITRLEIAP
ncbi:hypothetical protein GGR25_004336 [Kaistia hirudinis]|uniref:SnoaL-like domain-containing protein n=1 Tax=Kaistia hirudinis TaxID=1293440 RepID=A0A840AUA9_9HYPH|nr:nuclear transport factor 2 family protein [Kaistia hirudinis]MBB3933272.1 hypothetical protein [Kaistia hirudinis]